MNLSKFSLTKVVLAASLSLFVAACGDNTTPTVVPPTPAPAPTPTPTPAPSPTPAAPDLRLTSAAAAGDSQISVTSTGNLAVGDFLRFGGSGQPQVIVTSVVAPNTVRFSPVLPAGFAGLGVGQAVERIAPPALTLTASASAGATTVTVTSSTGVVVGSLIRFGTFIPNVLGGGAFSQIGAPVRVTAVTGNVITFTPGLSASLPAGAQSISTLQVTENSPPLSTLVRLDNPAGLTAYAPQGLAALSNFFTLGSGSPVRGVMAIAGNLVTHNIQTTIVAGDTLVPAATLPALYTTLVTNTATVTFAAPGNVPTAIPVNSTANIVANSFVDFQNVGGTPISPGGGAALPTAGLTRVRVTSTSASSINALSPVTTLTPGTAIPQLSVGFPVSPQPTFAFGATSGPVQATAPAVIAIIAAGATSPAVNLNLTAGSVSVGDVLSIVGAGANLTVASVAATTTNNQVTVTLTNNTAAASTATTAGAAVTTVSLPTANVVVLTTPSDTIFFRGGDSIVFANGVVAPITGINNNSRVGFGFNPAPGLALTLTATGNITFATAPGTSPLTLQR